MQHDVSKITNRIKAAPRRALRIIRRAVHGEVGEQIWIDVPCERCEKERCRLLGLRHPQPDWGTAAWFHPPPIAALPAFSHPPVPQRAPEWLIRAAELWAAKQKHPSPPVSVDPLGEEEPSSSWSTGSGGSAPF